MQGSSVRHERLKADRPEQPETADPLLQVRSLCVRVPTAGQMRTVVSDVSLDINRGEAVGLVGESGSGKSMTARSIIRLLPTGSDLAGSIVLAGRSVLSMSRAEIRELRAKEVGMVFQDPTVHINPVRRVGDFLTESLRFNLGRTAAEADHIACSLLGEVGIANPEQCLRRYPHQLSGGMLQRVMIAGALAPNPRLVLADEPTSALDVTTQAEVMAILEQLRRERGLAMLFITHDLNLAAATCNRTLVMYAGVVVEAQASTKLHNDPLHPYTAGLVSSRPNQAREGKLSSRPGRPLSSSEAPPWCVFAGRCPYVQTECMESRPPVRRLGSGIVACFRAEELRGTLLPGGGTPE
jgi:oligopeptide/dipeptide ABC transporter ATP-binding protein